MQIEFNPNPNPNSNKSDGRDRGLPGAHLPLSPPPALLRCRTGRTTQAAGREVMPPSALRLGLRGQGRSHKGRSTATHSALGERAQARGPAAAPPPSFSPVATGCRRVVVVSDCGAEEEKGKGKRKEEEEGEPDLVRWLSSSLASTATVAAAAVAARQERVDGEQSERY